MTAELFTALVLFCFVSSITPGPNNLMLMASGANFGVRRTTPHMLGISIGFGVMVVLVGVGLVQVFDAFPVSYVALKTLSVAYLLYLAWKIANAAAPTADGPDKDGSSPGAPMTFLQAAAFQWVNPKAWAMALTALSAYAAGQSVRDVALVAVIFSIVNLPSVGLWAALGQQMRRLLTNAARLRAFNFAMAALLVCSLYPVVVGH